MVAPYLVRLLSMNPAIALLLIPSAAASFAFSPTANVPPAEEAASQAPETQDSKGLEAFECLLGDWSASGTRTKPDGTTAAWKTSFQMKRDLGDHIIRFTLNSFRPDEDETVTGVSFIGFDAHQNVIRRVGFTSDTAGARRSTIEWVDENTMVELFTQLPDGTPQLTRCTWRVDGDQIDWTREIAMGAGPFQVTNHGLAKRTDAATAVDASATRAGGTTTPAAMAGFAPMVGNFDVTLFVADGGADSPAELLTGEMKSTMDVGNRVMTAQWWLGENYSGVMVYYEAAEAGEYGLLAMNSQGHFEVSPTEFVGENKVLSFTRLKGDDGWRAGRMRREVRPDGSQVMDLFRIGVAESAPALRLQATLTPKAK